MQTITEIFRTYGPEYIERYGDRAGYQKAAQARRWLLQRSKKEFANS